MTMYLLIVGIIATFVAMIIVTKSNLNQWWQFGWIVPAVLITLFGAMIIAAPPAPVYSKTIAVSYTAMLKKDGRFYDEKTSVDSEEKNVRVVETHFVGADKILFTVFIDGQKRLYEALEPETFIADYNSKKEIKEEGEDKEKNCDETRFKVGEKGCKMSELFVAVPVMDTVLLRQLNFDSTELPRHR